MTVLHLACLNNDPEIQPFLGPKCAPTGGEPCKQHKQSILLRIRRSINVFLDLHQNLTPLNSLSVLLSERPSVCLSVCPPDSPFGPKGLFSPPQELERTRREAELSSSQ